MKTYPANWVEATGRGLQGRGSPDPRPPSFFFAETFFFFIEPFITQFPNHLPKPCFIAVYINILVY